MQALQAYVCLLQIEGELLHISLAMLVAALFFLLFVWDAIVYENAFELMASSILAVVVAVRVLYFVVSAAAFLWCCTHVAACLCGLQHAGCIVAVSNWQGSRSQRLLTCMVWCGTGCRHTWPWSCRLMPA